MLRSIGQETEDPESSTSLPRRFYAQANEQIMASKIKNGSYTALDATAALQLVSFSLFVGGVRGWENALQIAGDWYEKTGVLQHENPLRAMWELNVTAKFASRLVVWFDIFSCKHQFHNPSHPRIDSSSMRRRRVLRCSRNEAIYGHGLPSDSHPFHCNLIFQSADRNSSPCIAFFSFKTKKPHTIPNIHAWIHCFLIAITLQKPARFLATYRKMLRQNDESVASQKFWRKDLNMQATMGAPDAVLLSIAEIADLAAWKDQEKKQGSLSYRELNLRADAIEQDLRLCKEELELEEARAVLASSSGVQSANGAYFGSAYANTTTGMTIPGVATSAPGTPSSTSGESVSSFMHATPSGAAPISLPLSFPEASTASTQGTSPTADLFSAFPGGAAPVGSNASRPNTSSSGGSTTRIIPVSDPVLPQGLSDTEVRRRTARIFLEGTSLYLQSIVNDSNPNVAEVVEGVRSTMEAAYLLPPSDVDKSLVFPFFMAGVMAESPEQREFFRARLSAHRAVGNCSEAVKLMEAVWKRREDASLLAAAQGIAGVKQRVHWRDVMNELGMKLLFI